MDESREQVRGMVPVKASRGGMRSLLDEFDRLMGGSFGWPLRIRPFTHSLGSTYEWAPDIDVFEKDGKIVVRADLPGMERDDIEVSVQDDTLVVRGHREEEKEIKGETYYGSERATGRFYRAVGLPAGVDPNEIEASYKDGVLQVSVPKMVVQEPQKVQIKVE